jgi:hypothetical protein
VNDKYRLSYETKRKHIKNTPYRINIYDGAYENFPSPADENFKPAVYTFEECFGFAGKPPLLSISESMNP